MLRQLLRVGLALPKVQITYRINPVVSVQYKRYFSSELTSDWPDSIKAFLQNENITSPTEIQEKTLPTVMENRDLVGIARTGSGKTLAFVIPAVIKILNSRQEASINPRDQRKATCLVLAPTRELADQTGRVFEKFRRLNIESCLLVGGASRARQTMQLERGNQDVYIATPGRLIDLVKTQEVDLTGIKYLVLDEADRMLDMGFEPQIRAILEAMPNKRQTVMWSATWPEDIKALAEDFMTDYSYVAVDSETLKANPNIEQKFIIDDHNRTTKLLDLIDEGLKENPKFKCLIFTNTKVSVDRLERLLLRNRYRVVATHGGKSQRQRDDAVQMFRAGRCNIMIATDVAARGLDISDINVVINLDLPTNIEDYIHRIGRTARHNNKGASISFVKDDDAAVVKKLIKVLEENNQEIPDELRTIAQNNVVQYKSNRSRSGSSFRPSYRSSNSFYQGGQGSYRQPYDNDRQSFRRRDEYERAVFND